MFLTAKVHVISGMIIGALAVMAMKQMCKQRETHKHSPLPAETPQENAAERKNGPNFNTNNPRICR